nr:hypothetical protein BN444_01244 [Xanthomonas translucens pv. translucens DSM 18974]
MELSGSWQIQLTPPPPGWFWRHGPSLPVQWGGAAPHGSRASAEAGHCAWRSAAAAARLLAVQRWTRHGGNRARRRCRRCRTTLPCAFIPALLHGAARTERCSHVPWNPRHRRASAPHARRPLAGGGMWQPRCAGVNAARALPVQPATRSTPFWPPGGVPSNWVRAATSSACRRMRPISRMMRMSSWRSARLANTSRL